MKKLLTALLFIVIAVAAYANCGNLYYAVYPQQRVIPKNSLFILEGYGEGQTIIEKIADYKVYLISSEEKVLLLADTIYKGQFHISQAVMKPTIPLREGANYYLKIIGLPKEHERYLKRTNGATYRSEDYTWTIKEEDNTAPVLNSALFKNNTREEFGCGPAVYANFTADVKENSEYYFMVSVSDSANKISTYIVPPNEDGTLEIGHGMCSGAFDFDKDKKYKIKIQVIDLTGRLSYKTQSFTITAP